MPLLAGISKPVSKADVTDVTGAGTENFTELTKFGTFLLIPAQISSLYLPSVFIVGNTFVGMQRDKAC